MIRNIIIILWFAAIFWLTIYLSARIHVKYMVKAIDIEWTVFKELIKKFKNLKEIKDLKSIKKNIRLCKCMEILLFLITLIILLAIEVIIWNYNLYGLKLYKVLLIIYSIYNMMGILSNEYKQVITSEYAFIFACILELKSVYEYNLNKIPFINKLEVYNSASNQIKFKNKKGNSWYGNAETLLLETYIENIRDSIRPDIEEEPKKNLDKPLHYEEREDGIYKIWEAKTENNLKITIIKSELNPYGWQSPYSVYAKRYDIENWKGRWYIEISSDKWFDLSGAKEIADKMKNIALKYVSPSPEKTNFIKNLPTSLDLKKTKDGRFTIRKTDVDENCKLTIIKDDKDKSYGVYVKMYKKEHWRTKWYIEISSSRWNSFLQAKIIAGKLYNIAMSYEVPWTDGK